MSDTCTDAPQGSPADANLCARLAALAKTKTSPRLLRIFDLLFLSRRCLFVLGLCVVLFIIAIAVWRWPEPQLRTTFHGEGETITLTVINPDVAAFRIGHMRAVSATQADAEGQCVAGLVMPRTGAVVTYARTSRLIVRIVRGDGMNASAPVAAFDPLDQSDTLRQFRDDYRFVEDAACTSGALPERLPVHGAAEFGREYSPATSNRDAMTGYLSSGQLTVYGKATESIPHFSSTLYEVTNMSIPSGSRLSATVGENGNEPPVWWGVAQIDAAKSGFVINASTGARVLALNTPGIDDGASVIRVGRFAQLTKDPNFIGAQLILIIGLWLLKSTYGLWKIVRGGHGKDRD